MKNIRVVNLCTWAGASKMRRKNPRESVLTAKNKLDYCIAHAVKVGGFDIYASLLYNYEHNWRRNGLQEKVIPVINLSTI